VRHFFSYTRLLVCEKQLQSYTDWNLLITYTGSLFYLTHIVLHFPPLLLIAVIRRPHLLVQCAVVAVFEEVTC